jgi:hypothetical protein
MIARSRRAVVELADYREAARAATFLAGLLERAPWVRAVRAEVAADGEVVIAVFVEPPLTVMRSRVLPSRCNSVRVDVREERR